MRREPGHQRFRFRRCRNGKLLMLRYTERRIRAWRVWRLTRTRRLHQRTRYEHQQRRERLPYRTKFRGHESLPTAMLSELGAKGQRSTKVVGDICAATGFHKFTLFLQEALHWQYEIGLLAPPEIVIRSIFNSKPRSNSSGTPRPFKNALLFPSVRHSPPKLLSLSVQRPTYK